MELVARTRGGRFRGGIGEDVPLAQEALHLAASDRMVMPVGDVADIRSAEADPASPGPRADRVTILANVMGLIGATPVLPSYYSEVQLQRRRLRDQSMADFYNIFDHRALSFLYRIARKYSWLIAHERLGDDHADPISNALLAYAGLPTGAMRDRLAFPDVALTPLAGHLGDGRRSAVALTAVLGHVTGLALRVREAVPTWLALPAGEQTRIGGPGRSCSARLGERLGGGGSADAAMVGANFLDVQHHYEIEVGPLDRAAFLAFVTGDEMLGRIRDACRLMTGVEHRPRLRLLLARDEAAPLQLGAASACLSRTSWLGSLDGREPVLADCTIPIR